MTSEPPEPSPLNQQPSIEYARDILTETREEIVRADGKASILFVVSGVVGSIVAGAIVAGGWSPGQLGQPWVSAWWVGAAATITGVLLLGWSVVPRVAHRGPKEQVAYFGHVVQFFNKADFQHALIEAAEVPLNRLIDQIWTLSDIVQRKYRATRNASFIIAAGLALMAVSTLAGHLQ